MYVCICNAVTESQIRDAISQGLSTRKEISACLKAGTACGKCNADVRDLLQRACAPNGDASAGKYCETRRYVMTTHSAAASRIRRASYGPGATGAASLRKISAGT